MSNFLGGHSSSSGSSSNLNYGNSVNNLGGIAAQGQGAAANIAALLGNGGSAAQQGAFNNFKNSSGYNFDLSQGSDAITGNAAASGLLNSGSTLKALSNYGQNTANNFLNQYLQNQSSLAGLGIQANNSINSAGQVNNSSGNQKQGLGL